jgi:hypothetical protein
MDLLLTVSWLALVAQFGLPILAGNAVSERAGLAGRVVAMAVVFVACFLFFMATYAAIGVPGWMRWVTGFF